jgi:hypothetical protein
MTPEKEASIYDRMREIFLYGDRHPKMIQLRQKIRRDFAMYDNDGEWFYDGIYGKGQWRQDDLDALKDRGQMPLVINVTKRVINSFVSAEINNRSRIGYRSHFSTPENQKLAELLTSAGLYVQESLDVQRKMSMVLKDGSVCGLGWLWCFEDPATSTLSFETLDPWYLIPDMDDVSSDFTQMRFVCRKYWTDLDIAKRTWKNFDKFYKNLSPSLTQGSKSRIFWDKESSYTTNLDAFMGNSRTVLICEVQTKERKKCYRGVTRAGNSYATFDEDEAEKYLDPKEDIDESPADQIMRTLFCGNILLEHAPLHPLVPDLEDFSYIPFVYSKTSNSSLPDGMVSNMFSSQIDINARRVKAVYALGSRKEYLTLEGSNFSEENIDSIEENAKSLDGRVYLPKGTIVTPVSNSDIGRSQLELYNIAHAEIEKETGFHPESMGETTGANQSGVAISRLQRASMMGQNFSYDAYVQFKKRVGRMMASILQRRANLPVFAMGKKDMLEIIDMLNAEEEDINGESYIANDVRGLPFGVYVEEMPNIESSFAETRDDLERLLSHPQVDMIIQNQPLLESLGYRNADQIVHAAISAIQQKSMAEHAGKNAVATGTSQNNER